MVTRMEESQAEEPLAEESREYENGLQHFVSRGGIPAEGGGNIQH